MVILNYGGGTNSTALLLEAHQRGLRPDLIVFADTGSERPETYQYLEIMQRWLTSVRFPAIEVVRWIRRDGTFVALDDWCFTHRTLPSKAFGLAGCTAKWKQQPIDRWLRSHPAVRAEHVAGHAVERWIGYDADEPERAQRMLNKNPSPTLWRWRAPLVDWDLGRDECLAAIDRARLPRPGKSSCYMCPSMKKPEILDLRRRHPELLQRALELEAGAELHSIRGLGRSFSWRAFVDGARCEAEVVPEDCGCYDGDV